MEYKAELEKLDPKVEYLMTLYLHENMLEEIDVDGQKTLRGVQEVRKASKAGVKGTAPIGAVYLVSSQPLIFCTSKRYQVVSPRSDHEFFWWNRVV